VADRPRLMVHRDQGSKAAVVLIHGFGGDAAATWGRFPELLAADPRLRNWDLFSVGYATSLAFDLAGIWSADPSLVTLGGLLDSVADVPPFDRYESLAFLAHSMGGLLLQQALVSSDRLASRTGHVLLFGTPSAGLEKASPFRFWKRQIRDMASGSEFITTLRARWDQRFGGTPPFVFAAIAGDRDEFVPYTSSLEPFAGACRRVVYGNHLEIVKPPAADHLGFKTGVKALLGGEGGAGPFDSARVAAESRRFQQAIDQFLPHYRELDDSALVTLALALESVGRQPEAIEILSNTATKTTDPMGVLAGRLKRRWLVEHRGADAERALSLYRSALELAEQKADRPQAFYHAINVAFMKLAYGQDVAAARSMATRALEHCAAFGKRDLWRFATEGEAHLYLGNPEAALAAYANALALSPEPRNAGSMYQQAIRVADLMRQDETIKPLQALFMRSTAGISDGSPDPAITGSDTSGTS